jgi:hypothetical protein
MLYKEELHILILFMTAFILWQLWLMGCNATFNIISVILWRSVLLVEETEIPGENQSPAVSH